MRRYEDVAWTTRKEDHQNKLLHTSGPRSQSRTNSAPLLFIGNDQVSPTGSQDLTLTLYSTYSILRKTEVTVRIVNENKQKRNVTYELRRTKIVRLIRRVVTFHVLK